MPLRAGKISTTVENEAKNIADSGSSPCLSSMPQEARAIAPSKQEEDVCFDEKDEKSPSLEDGTKQLIVYDPAVNGGSEATPRSSTSPNPPSRSSLSVGAFTVQCANCLNWRLIPTKEKYEEIREHILEKPFVCHAAREWRPEISCANPPDISQDGSRLWAIDKPNIAQPPPGWQRLLHFRAAGCSKFADVYYRAPCGKKLRSNVEIKKYLFEHPEYKAQGVTPLQFSFLPPKRLQGNHVRNDRKRPHLTTSGAGASKEFSKPLHAEEGLDERTGLQLGREGCSTSSSLAKKKARRMPQLKMEPSHPPTTF